MLAMLGSAFALGLQLGRGSHKRLMLGDTAHFADHLAQQKQQIADLRAAAAAAGGCHGHAPGRR